MPDRLDLKYEEYVDNIPLSDKYKRLLWMIVCKFFFVPFGLPIFNKWRLFLLRLFGAEIGYGSIVYSSTYIPAPWMLKMGEKSCLGPHVKLHIGKTTIGNKVTISQGTYLCSASHMINSLNTPFVSGEIIVHDFAWVAAESFIMMNVVIGAGVVVGARSVVVKNIEPWVVVGGNPAKILKNRLITE